MKDKYEGYEGNLRSKILNLCVESFLKSDACKNLYAHLIYSIIRTVFKTVDDCIKVQVPNFKFLDQYQLYLDLAGEKDYVLPWIDSFESSRYFVDFPTPSPSDNEEEDNADDEGVANVGDDAIMPQSPKDD